MPKSSPLPPEVQRCFGLVVNPTKPGVTSLASEICSVLTDHGAEMVLDQAAARVLGRSSFCPWADMRRQCGLIIVLGGDGTLLNTARMLDREIPPLAGINTGRLGFLTTAAIEDKDLFLKTLCDRTWTVSRRRQIKATGTRADGRPFSVVALNEVTLTRGAISRTIQIEAQIDDEWLNRYSGDGIIVATPTGSTAYSLSAGGPIVSPEASAFVITPICGHALSNRTLIVNDASVIALTPSVAREQEVLLTADGGEPIALPAGKPVYIRRSAQEVPLVQMPGHRFYAVLRQKLGWSGSHV